MSRPRARIFMYLAVAREPPVASGIWPGHSRRSTRSILIESRNSGTHQLASRPTRGRSPSRAARRSGGSVHRVATDGRHRRIQSPVHGRPVEQAAKLVRAGLRQGCITSRRSTPKLLRNGTASETENWSLRISLLPRIARCGGDVKGILYMNGRLRQTSGR